MGKNAVIAKEFISECEKYGWGWAVSDDIVKINKHLDGSTHEDVMESFRIADSQYWKILGCLPTTRPGSTWGTDSSGVGGYVAVKNKYFEMCRSGVSKLVIKALAKEKLNESN